MKKNTYKKFVDDILQKRYSQKNEKAEVIETQQEMYMRVAKFGATGEILHGTDPAEVDDLTERVFELMNTGKMLPNSPALMNAGTSSSCCNACSVLVVKDDINDIYQVLKDTAILQKAGVGCGYAADNLRPKGDMISTSKGKATGPLSFFKVFNTSGEAVSQGGRRRSAHMLCMSIAHPDILMFITVKNSDMSAFNNFNFSVKVSDDFMQKLKESPGNPHVVVNPHTNRRYHIPRAVDPANYELGELVPADDSNKDCYTSSEVWGMIVKNAHKSGEPGVLFIDKINADNPTPRIGEIISTNPCGEQPLLDNEVCTLASINIAQFVEVGGANIEWAGFADAIQISVRFLDNLIDVNYYPLKKVRKASLETRKIGLGIMGLADAFIKMGIVYGSEESLELAGEIGVFLKKHAHNASQTLAETRGSFPAWEGSLWDTEYNRKMRNAAVTTIAPTGSISLIAGCSSGIEPVYSYVYSRKTGDSGTYNVIHPLLARIGTTQSWLTDEIIEQLDTGKGTTDIHGIPKNLAKCLVTAHQVIPEQHVRMQAVFQEHIDNAVSKTVNLPTKASVEDVSNVFRLAYKLGCKGTTIYRDGSRDGQILTTSQNTNLRDSIRKRPETTTGQTSKYTMGCGTLFVTVNRDDKGICEVFANLGKAGGCPAQSEATCRAVSAALRSGVTPEILIKQLKGIRCLSAMTRRQKNGQINVMSCPDAIAKALQVFIQPGTKMKSEERTCQECGGRLAYQNGCETCLNCGDSDCG